MTDAKTASPPPVLQSVKSTSNTGREAIITFTRQALEIEAKRNGLMDYFAELRDTVGLHAQVFAIERYFPNGVTAALRGVPPAGLEGMVSLRNRLMLLNCPQSMQSIKSSLIQAYNSEIEQAQLECELEVNWGDPIRKLVYPEITKDNLDCWRQLAQQSNPGPVQDLYRYEVGTIWFGIQELRHNTYTLWADTLGEQQIDIQKEGFIIQTTPEPYCHQNQQSISEEAYGPYAAYSNLFGFPQGYLTPAQTGLLGLAEPLNDVFKLHQWFCIFVDSGIQPQPYWESYVQLFAGGGARSVYNQAEYVMKSLFEMTNEQRERAGLTFEDPTIGTGKGGTPRGPDSLETLQHLMALGLANTLGPQGGAYAASRIPYLQQQWARTRKSDGQSFIDYIKGVLVP